METDCRIIKQYRARGESGRSSCFGQRRLRHEVGVAFQGEIQETKLVSCDGRHAFSHWMVTQPLGSWIATPRAENGQASFGIRALVLLHRAGHALEAASGFRRIGAERQKLLILAQRFSSHAASYGRRVNASKNELLRRDCEKLDGETSCFVREFIHCHHLVKEHRVTILTDAPKEQS